MNFIPVESIVSMNIFESIKKKQFPKKIMLCKDFICLKRYEEMQNETIFFPRLPYLVLLHHSETLALNRLLDSNYIFVEANRKLRIKSS